MNVENVTVKHDITEAFVKVDVNVRVDRMENGEWVVNVLVYIESTSELHKDGVFYIPQEAKSVQIDFGSVLHARDVSVKYCITEEFYEDDAIELDWDDVKIA